MPFQSPDEQLLERVLYGWSHRGNTAFTGRTLIQTQGLESWKQQHIQPRTKSDNERTKPHYYPAIKYIFIRVLLYKSVRVDFFFYIIGFESARASTESLYAIWQVQRSALIWFTHKRTHTDTLTQTLSHTHWSVRMLGAGASGTILLTFDLISSGETDLSSVIHKSSGQKQALETTKSRRIGERKWCDIEWTAGDVFVQTDTNIVDRINAIDISTESWSNLFPSQRVKLAN